VSAEQSVEFSLAEETDETAEGEDEKVSKPPPVDRDRATVVSEEEDNAEDEEEEEGGGEDENETSESAAAAAGEEGEAPEAAEEAAEATGAARAERAERAGEGEEDEEGEEEEESMAPPIERTRRWMLADADRSSAISDAIVQTVETALSLPAAARPTAAAGRGSGTVVCVGGGSGLCASAAATVGGGCGHVIAVEWTADRATAVRGALSSSSSGMTAGNPEITVVDGAGELKETLQTLMKAHSIGDQGKGKGEPRQIDALVAEPFFVPLDEGRAWAKGHALLWWWSVHTVRAANLLAPTAKVWPA